MQISEVHIIPILQRYFYFSSIRGQGGGMNALHGMTSLILVTAWIDVLTMVTWNRSNDRVRVYRIQYIHYLLVPFRVVLVACKN